MLRFRFPASEENASFVVSQRFSDRTCWRVLRATFCEACSVPEPRAEVQITGLRVSSMLFVCVIDREIVFYRIQSERYN